MAHEEHIYYLSEAVEELAVDNEIENAVSLLTNRHPADQADILYELDEEVARHLVQAMSPVQLADLIEYLNDDLRASLLPVIPPEVLAPALDRVEDDLTVDVIQELSPDVAEQVISLLDEPESYRELLSYPEESAGGRMSPDVVALRRDWTVDEAIQFLRHQRPDTDHPFYLYAVDDQERLIGIVSLRALVIAAPETPVAAIMSDEVQSVLTTDDQEVAAERMRHYNLLALPVVDAANRLRGVLTADDVLDVQVEEATEDIYRMAGLPEEESLFRPIRQSVPPRLGWLLINLCTAMLAVATVNFFEGTIQQVAALAVFMPMVAGMGGNAGIQTITLVVRSIALGEVDPRDAVLVIKHEALIALIKGVVIGLLVAVIAYIWKGDVWLGLIVGLALLGNIANATLVGVLVPLGLKRLNIDPALASGVIVTTFSDVMGFLLFLGLATLLLAELT